MLHPRSARTEVSADVPSGRTAAGRQAPPYGSISHPKFPHSRVRKSGRKPCRASANEALWGGAAPGRVWGRTGEAANRATATRAGARREQRDMVRSFRKVSTGDASVAAWANPVEMLF